MGNLKFLILFLLIFIQPLQSAYYPVPLPSTSGNVLKSNGSKWTSAVPPAVGSTGYIQYNNSGNLGAESNLFWDNTNKRLGIGMSPTRKLNITSAINDGIQITDGTTTSFFYSSADATNSLALGTSSNHPMSIWTNNTKRLTVLSTGNVGINNTSPGAKLDVSSEVRVSASGGATGQLLADSTDFYVGPTGAHNLRLQTNGSTRMIIDNDGNIQTPGIHNNASPPTNTTPVISSGTYSPTLTNRTNIASSTTAVCNYSRVGNVVTVSGYVEADPTSTTTDSALGISLPIASGFTLASDARGVASVNLTAVYNPGIVLTDTANDIVEVRFTSVSALNQGIYFNFSYLVK